MGDQKKERTPQSEYISQDVAVLFFVLRDNTTPKRALTIPSIANDMSFFLGNYTPETLRRTMKKILKIQDEADKEDPDETSRTKKRNMAEILYSTYGGRIVKTDNSKYYFEPLLKNSVMRMLNGTVVSNQFLSEDEKRYLLSRMKFLNILGDSFGFPEEVEEERPWIAPYPEREKLSKEINPFPGEGNVYLSNASYLDRAILAKRQIKISYGIYDYSDDKMDFHERMNGDSPKIYHLNPYALFWCGGRYYLLATYVTDKQPDYIKEPDTPIHFRVDRILRIKILGEEEREALPNRLEDCFSQDEVTRRRVFDERKYAARFPAMRISSKKNLINCVIECTPWSLQVLVDAFGSTLPVKKSRRRHEENELDYNGRAQTFLEAKIEGVEFDNIRDFCLANPEYLTPLSPPKLVSAVKEKLENILKKYEETP